MKVSPRIRSVTAITATALALGLGGFAAAVPAQARTAEPANPVPTVAHVAASAASAATAATVTDCYPTGDISGGGGSYPDVTETGVSACELTPTWSFGDSSAVIVDFSDGDNAKLTMQGDGNFCWYYNTSSFQAVKCSGTNGQPGDYAAWQGDGNLVVYDAGVAKWATGTNGRGVYLALQADGNLVIYGYNSSGGFGPIWAAF
jgi:hypothetical protein